MKKMKRTLCLLLVLAMSLSLMNLPAFAVTDPSSESACTMEEHKHTEACYAPGEPVLTCEEEHEHTEACYTPGEPVLSCTLEEHEHSEDCAAAPVVEDEPEETDTTELPALFGLREADGNDTGTATSTSREPLGSGWTEEKSKDGQDTTYKKLESSDLNNYENGKWAIEVVLGDVVVAKQAKKYIIIVAAGDTRSDSDLDAIANKDPGVQGKSCSGVLRGTGDGRVENTPVHVENNVVSFGGDLSHINIMPGTPNPETISVKVTKVCQDAEGEVLTDHPSSVTVQLYKGGTAEGSEVTLNAPDWAYTWDKLDKDGNYTVKEVEIKGYESKVTGDATQGFTITNKAKPTDPPPPPTPETGDLTIHKVVEALGNPIVEDVDFTFNVQGPDAVKDNTYTADGNQFVSFDETGKATVTIKGQGNVTVKDLPAGEYTISENTPNGPEGYTWKGVSFKNHSDQDKDAQITVCVGTDNGSKNVQVNAHNRYEKTPDPEPKTVNLAVTKAVKYDKTASNAPDAEKMFTIRVQLGDVEGVVTEDIYADTENAIKKATYMEDGVYVISLKAGETATIHKIPVGTKYTVLEDDPGAGWTKSGEVTAATVLTKNAAVTVTNTYKPTTPDPEPETVNLAVTKAVEYDKTASNAPDADEMFTIRVQLGDVEGVVTEDIYADTENAIKKATYMEDGVYVISLKAGETATIHKIPVGTKYTVLEDDPGAGWTKSGEVTAATELTENAAVTVTNTYKPTTPDPKPETVSLAVTKTVVDATADHSVPADATFTIKVKLGNEEKVVAQTIHADDELRTTNYLEDGVYVISLKAGETATIHDIPVGTKYTVLEDDPGAGWTKSGEVTAATELTENAAVTVTNTYKPTTPDPKPETVSLAVTKTVVDATANHSVPADATFTIKVKLGNEEKVVAQTIHADDELRTTNYLEDGVYVISLKAGETATIHKIPVGTEYTVLEDDPGAGWTKSGEVTAATELTENAAVTVTNTYKPMTPEPEPETGALTVTKTVVDATADHSVPADATFTIKVKLGGEDTPATLAEGEEFNGNGTYTFRLKGGESAAINGIPAGTAYEVSEDNPGRGWVSAVNTGSGVIDGEASVSVTNTWNGTRDTGTTDPDPSTGSLKITKVIDGGGEAATEEVFTFTVAGPDGFNQSVEITGAGEVTLNDLEPGNYTVTESDADISGYNWEKSGDGSVTVTADATAEVTVTNTYRTEVIVPDPETPTTRPDPRPTPRPTPTPDPEPETDIPDDPTPRVDVPDAPTPEVNIPDDPTPKTDIPDAPTPEVNIPDAPTPEVNIPDDPTPKTDIPDVQPPMISWPPVVEVPEEDIPDEDVPMASVPKTGDISLVWYAAALLSACGLSALTIKKRKDEEQD